MEIVIQIYPNIAAKVKDNEDWRFQRESRKDFKMPAVYQAGVNPGSVGTEAYTIWRSSLRKLKIKLDMKMNIYVE